MSKVVLTKEQGEAIEVLKSAPRDHWGYVAERMKEKSFSHDYEPFNHMMLDDVIKAYYEGYEIEQPKFEVGDWVVRKGKVQQIKFVLASCAIGQEFYYETDKIGVVYKSEIRHATKEEIFWAELGREVGEFKKGDVVVTNGFNSSYKLESKQDFLDIARDYKGDYIKGFYPAESFKPFPTGDES
ncbi:MAG: hypothetical protein R3328_00225 [Planococcaceae bacterium]|nr:hypothetical protein [Planococcaceae bacterium]